MLILCKAGPLRNGAERGKGTIWHAVPSENAKALCGAAPAIMWSTYEGDAVTCPRCRRALEREPELRDFEPTAEDWADAREQYEAMKRGGAQ